MTPLKFHLSRASEKPLFVQVQQTLRDAIRRGELREGDQLPGLTKLAELAGVSNFTIEQAVLGLIREGYLLRRPKKGTYVGTPGAVAPSARKVIFNLVERERFNTDPFHWRGLLSIGIQSAAQEGNCVVTSLSASQFLADFPIYENKPDFQIVGVILTDLPSLAAVQPLAQTHGRIPFVLTNAWPEDDMKFFPENVVGVFNDEFGGAYEIASYALRSNRCKPAIFSRETKAHFNTNYRRRVEGFLQAAKDVGVEVDERHILIHRSKADFSIGGELAAQLAKTEDAEKIDTIFCVNDEFAIGALERLSDLSPSLRRDLLVTGFDNYSQKLLRAPAFPTVAIDFVKMGMTAVETCLRFGRQYVPRAVKLQPLLIRRDQESPGRTPSPGVSAAHDA